jgi:hypothetical protein
VDHVGFDIGLKNFSYCGVNEKTRRPECWALLNLHKELAGIEEETKKFDICQITESLIKQLDAAPSVIGNSLIPVSIEDQPDPSGAYRSKFGKGGAGPSKTQEVVKRLSYCLYTYLKTKQPTRQVNFVNAKKKFSAVQLSKEEKDLIKNNYYQRKKMSVTITEKLLTHYGHTDKIEWLRQFSKKDDLADSYNIAMESLDGLQK